MHKLQSYGMFCILYVALTLISYSNFCTSLHRKDLRGHHWWLDELTRVSLKGIGPLKFSMLDFSKKVRVETKLRTELSFKFKFLFERTRRQKFHWQNKGFKGDLFLVRKLFQREKIPLFLVYVWEFGSETTIKPLCLCTCHW